MTSSGPSQRQVEMNLAIIAKLRDIDTTGEFTAICDEDELAWRRAAMDGWEKCEGGGIVGVSHCRSVVELLHLDPAAYFEITSQRRPQFGSVPLSQPRSRRSVPSTDEERAQAWVEAREVVRRERPTMLRRWLRRSD